MKPSGVYNLHWQLALLTVLLIIPLLAVRPVRARENDISIFNVSQQDLNGDGRPDLTQIDCAFVSDLDRISVLDQGKDMRSSGDWQQATDFHNDIWLYDIGADGSVQLIVVYKVEKGDPVAYVYDDRDGDGQVSYERSGIDVNILESPHWITRIVSGSDWFLPDGRVNLNVRFEIDGPVPTLDRAPESYTQDWMLHDGLIDVEFEEVAGRDGIAQYAVKRLITDSPRDWGFERAGLLSNEGRYPTGSPERAFFPFLSIPIDRQNPKYNNLRYFDLPPNLNVDWLSGKVVSVGLDGYPIGHGYLFNNSQYIVKGQVNDVAFESPQAYYDLAKNHDAFAEMHVRFFTHPANDRTMWSLPNFEAIPWQSISYDWNLFNLGTLRWDFKVGLGGNHTIDSVIRFRDFAVRSVPFEQLPYWITEREWKLTTFVAREGEGYESSEGIYEWQADTGDDPEQNPERAIEARDATFGYMLGTLDQTPDAYFQTSHPGFRAERHFADPIQPRLYFSPLDRKMHLLGAEDGVWTIDDRRLIRYGNLDRDAYLDQWSYFEDGGLQREFYWAGNHLIYAGENEIWFEKATIAASLFDTLPPRNHEDWLAQRQMLETNQPEFAPEDLKAMLTQFHGSSWQLKGATMRNFRRDGEGFRFILELRPGFQIVGLGGPSLDDIAPGTYVVSYQKAFVVTPSSPAIPSVALQPVTLTAFQINSLPVEVRNDGLEDLPQATLELWATSPDGTTSVVTTEGLQLLAQQSFTEAFHWAPASSGTWVLTPIIRQSDGSLISGDPVSLAVAPPQNKNPINLLFASTSPERLPLILFALISLATLIGLAFWYEWGKPLMETVNIEEQYLTPKSETINILSCPHCQTQEKQNKAGFNRSGSQRYRCGQCKKIYTPYPNAKGYPVETRQQAIQMYIDGNSYGAIARALKVSRQSVVNWVKRSTANLPATSIPLTPEISELDKSYTFGD